MNSAIVLFRTHQNILLGNGKDSVFVKGDDAVMWEAVGNEVAAPLSERDVGGCQLLPEVCGVAEVVRDCYPVSWTPVPMNHGFFHHCGNNLGGISGNMVIDSSLDENGDVRKVVVMLQYVMQVTLPFPADVGQRMGQYGSICEWSTRS